MEIRFHLVVPSLIGYNYEEDPLGNYIKVSSKVVHSYFKNMNIFLGENETGDCEKS